MKKLNNDFTFDEHGEKLNPVIKLKCLNKVIKLKTYQVRCYFDSKILGRRPVKKLKKARGSNYNLALVKLFPV